MLVLAQASSIKISLRGFRVGWFSRHSARALATSGRFCSAACKVFLSVRSNKGQGFPHQDTLTDT
jgi:hypothetical protein